VPSDDAPQEDRVTTETAAAQSNGLSMLDMPMATDREAGWAMLRAQGPLAELDGVLFATDPETIREMLANPEIFSSQQAYAALPTPVPWVPLMFDPPDAVRYRRLLAPFFSPGVINRMNDALRAQVRELLTPIAARGHADIVPELAVPYPSQVFLTLMGLPLADRDQLIAWKDAMLGATDPHAQASGIDVAAEVQALLTYLTDQIRSRKGRAGEDLLTRVVNDPSPDALDDTELLGMAFLLVNAGLDTVTSTLALAFEWLAKHPELQRRLAADRSLIPRFVEEVVRLNPVAAFTPRATTRETTLAGRDLPAGTTVLMAWAAANRDPAVYADPTTLDLDREGPHWGFGGGVHRCLGSHLARAELRLVFEEWFAAIPEFRFEDGFEPVMPWPVPLLTMPSVRLVFPTAGA
jgi:cytochrome P450